MKFVMGGLYAALCLFITVHATVPELETPIRVLIHEQPLEGLQLRVSSQQGIRMYDPSSQTTGEQSSPAVVLTTQGSRLFVNSRQASAPLVLIPQNKSFTLGEATYEGYLEIQQKDNRMYVINHLSLEDYIMGVLPYEAVPTWPDEVLKALCIASRTYAVCLMQQRRKNGAAYDVRATVHDQVYNGKSRYNLQRIIDATRNQIITHEGKPICAMFHACCGGIIPAMKKTPMHTGKPYLKRTYACTHCVGKRFYRWEYHYSFEELEDTLKKRYPELGTLEDILITSYDNAGIAQRVRLQGTHKTITLKAQTFRSLFPEIRSISCSFTTKDKKLYATGKGHGHHLGLCQWGAYSMVTKGATYQQVLSYYYPDTSLTPLADLNLA